MEFYDRKGKLTERVRERLNEFIARNEITTICVDTRIEIFISERNVKLTQTVRC